MLRPWLFLILCKFSGVSGGGGGASPLPPWSRYCLYVCMYVCMHVYIYVHLHVLVHKQHIEYMISWLHVSFKFTLCSLSKRAYHTMNIVIKVNITLHIRFSCDLNNMYITIINGRFLTLKIQLYFQKFWWGLSLISAGLPRGTGGWGPQPRAVVVYIRIVYFRISYIFIVYTRYIYEN